MDVNSSNRLVGERKGRQQVVFRLLFFVSQNRFVGLSGLFALFWNYYLQFLSFFLSCFCDWRTNDLTVSDGNQIWILLSSISGVFVRLTTCKRLTNSLPKLSLTTLPRYQLYVLLRKIILLCNNWLLLLTMFTLTKSTLSSGQNERPGCINHAARKDEDRPYLLTHHHVDSEKRAFV